MLFIALETIDNHEANKIKYYIKKYLLQINKIYYKVDTSRIEEFVNYMDPYNYKYLYYYLSSNNHNLLKGMLKLFNNKYIHNVIKLSSNEHFIIQKPMLHIVSTFPHFNYIYRAELKKIENGLCNPSYDIYNFNFAIFYNNQYTNEIFTNVMKYRLVIYNTEKKIFILDRFGLTYNNGVLLEIYHSSNIYKNILLQTSKHKYLSKLSLQRLLPNYKIYIYSSLFVNIFCITTNIFKYIINYPIVLENILDTYLVNKINYSNYPYFKNSSLLQNKFNFVYIEKIWNNSIDTIYQNRDITNIWFEYKN